MFFTGLHWQIGLCIAVFAEGLEGLYVVANISFSFINIYICYSVIVTELLTLGFEILLFASYVKNRLFFIFRYPRVTLTQKAFF